MSKVKLIHIGTFSEPVGLKGEIKIITLITNPNSIVSYGPLMSNNSLITWDLKFIRVSNGKAVVKLKNMNTRESVESLRGKKIFVKRKNFPKVKKNEFYTMDLINCGVFSVDKKKIGIVKNIENYGAGDLINVKVNNCNEFLVPVNKDNIVSVDLLKKKIVINPIKGILD